ncbi:LytR/AlgR family response regulator transcription factor [Emticicia sp. 17c]|uniref:LytR/AlgR family response regulator transcription factor n=1 Tax=Emticicia sp. 17c TaxID=3127704 RepID=UPI00301E2EC1
MNETSHIQLSQKQQIAINEISFFQAKVNYTILHGFSGKLMLIAYPLKKIESILPKTHFVRSHKSFIVRQDFIRNINFRNKNIVLKDNTVVPISRRRVPDLRIVWNKQKYENRL